MRALAAFLAILLASAAAAGEVYRWRDSAGAWHFGDRPPPGSNAEWYDTRPRAGIDRPGRTTEPSAPDAGGSDAGATGRPVSGPR